MNHKGHPGNPFAALHTSKTLTETERLRLQLAKLEIENERLTKDTKWKGTWYGKGKQSDAVIFIQANLHVTKSRSDSNKVENNNAIINGLNSELAKLADGKSIFYLDANTIFDDESGSLSSDKSGDGTHLYAKYYSEWSEWIIRQTASLIGEGWFWPTKTHFANR